MLSKLAGWYTKFRQAPIKTLAQEDLFIKRLRSLVIGEGMLHEGNIYLMDLAIQQMPKDGVVVEIGSYGGLSTNLLLHLLKKHQRSAPLFNCDPWIYEGYLDDKKGPSNHIDGRSDVLRTTYSTYLKQAYCNAVQFLHPNHLPHTFQLSSDDFFDAYRQNATLEDMFGNNAQLGAPISFAYIDGNHASAYVKRDFQAVDDYLQQGGFILFDDSIDGSNFGSASFMETMKMITNYELVATNPNYLFRKTLSSKQWT